MKTFFNRILLIVNICSFIITVLFVIFSLYVEIVGPVRAEKLLQKLHIPLSYNQMLVVGFVAVVIMLISLNLRGKLSKRL